jgi:CII-binding regulator of phage lambda lysogenization HflD
MACVVVWKLARDTRPEAAELRTALVGLSGRQIARGKDSRGFTEPALLAGLELLVRMLTLLERHDLNDLRRLTEAVLPNLLPPAPRPPPGDV